MRREGMNRLLGTLAVTAAFGLAACGDGLGPNGTGHMAVSLQESGSTSIMASEGASEESSSPISMSAVSAVEITLDRVEALAVGRVDVEGAWVTLHAEGDVTVNLMDLASLGPVTVASGQVPAGTYANVRLFFSEATITTSEEIVLEGGGTVPPGTYDLFIPSGMETGVKIALGAVHVSEDETETVVLEIDTEGSVQTVVYNESEGFIMSSVLIQTGVGLSL